MHPMRPDKPRRCGILRRFDFAISAAQRLLSANQRFQKKMSLVRLLGFVTLGCGCVIGRYREVATNREVNYVEEKGKTCASHTHRRNHTVTSDRLSAAAPVLFATKAS